MSSVGLEFGSHMREIVRYMLIGMAFSTADYDPIRVGMIRSAQTVVPELMRLLTPASVVDIGCGQGVWLAEFARLGCPRIRGYDGHDGSRLHIPEDRYEQVDLASKNAIDGRYHLAMCLEVAEHLPEERSDWLVATLCALSSVVLFSAAIPGQGGVGHINEQWPDFWASKFEVQGYQVSGALRWKWWDVFPTKIESWYAQNMLLCVQDEFLVDHPLLPELFGHPADAALAVVHPDTWSRR